MDGLDRFQLAFGHIGLIRVNSGQIRFVCKSSSQFGLHSTIQN